MYVHTQRTAESSRPAASPSFSGPRHPSHDCCRRARMLGSSTRQWHVSPRLTDTMSTSVAARVIILSIWGRWGPTGGGSQQIGAQWD
ncbi:hypothetical protein C8035_v009644 [Colletotrichum spinosum]|uniref:Uncharacterized protein n=1 Tax=Colletotrichum spinosum TaxID=1347390 RepID=A0A4R8QE03_9PEZI|nr:hypothetical protein C8035_v009644 [Colletotrichum spinosum]